MYMMCFVVAILPYFWLFPLRNQLATGNNSLIETLWRRYALYFFFVAAINFHGWVGMIDLKCIDLSFEKEMDEFLTSVYISSNKLRYRL